jgi:hypothetical protein
MPAASLTFNTSFYKHLAEGKINLSTDAFRIYLTNTAPSGTTSLGASVTQLTNNNGYTTNGQALSTSTATLSSNGIYQLGFSTVLTWTGGTATMSDFQYVVLIDDTPVAPAKPIVGYWDLGSPVSLDPGQNFSISFGAGGIVRIPT